MPWTARRRRNSCIDPATGWVTATGPSSRSGHRGAVNPWFRERFKDLGTPVISGHISKLVHELKNFLT